MEEEETPDLAELLWELEEEYGTEEPLAPRVEALVRTLQSSPDYAARHDAAEELGNIATSSPRIVRALQTASESDPNLAVSTAAFRSLQARVHQNVRRQYAEQEDGATAERAPEEAPAEPRVPVEKPDLPPEVEELVRSLRSSPDYEARRDAAEALGKIGVSSPRIVRALIAAYESDPYVQVSAAAGQALGSPVHQKFLEQHPELISPTTHARLQRPGRERRQSAIRSGPSGAAERLSRKKPETDRRLGYQIVGGILLLVIGVFTLSNTSLTGPALIFAGTALLGWVLWIWRSPQSRRNIFRRLTKSAPASVESVGSITWGPGDSDSKVRYYRVTVRFCAEDGQGNSRNIRLEASYEDRMGKTLAPGDTTTVWYSADDPAIALIGSEY